MAVSRVHVRAHPGERAYDRMVAALRGLMKDGLSPGVRVLTSTPPPASLGILPRHSEWR